MKERCLELQSLPILPKVTLQGRGQREAVSEVHCLPQALSTVPPLLWDWAGDRWQGLVGR